MSDFNDLEDAIAPLDDSMNHGGDWSKGSDEEGDITSSPSDWGISTLPEHLSNDASRVTVSKPAAASTRTASSKSSTAKDDFDKSRATTKDSDASSMKHKPSRRSSGYLNSSSSVYDDRSKPSVMPYNSRSSHSSRSHRRNDDHDAATLLALVRTMATDFSEAKDTIARLEKEIKELKDLAHDTQDNQDEILRTCKAWEGHDAQYLAQGDASHSDDGSQFTDESNPPTGETSSDTAYDASRDVSNAPADEQQPVRDSETPDQERRPFEDEDHKSVKAPHDDEREPPRKRQRAEGANDQQNSGTQRTGWVSRYQSQSFPPHRNNDHPINGFNNQRGGFRGRSGHLNGYRNQGQHAAPPVAPYPQSDFGNNGGFRQPQRPNPRPFTPHPNAGAFTPHPSNNGPFVPPPPVPRRNSTFAPPNPNHPFSNQTCVSGDDMGYSGPQGPPQMGFQAPHPPQMRGVKRPFHPDMPQYGAEDYMQPPPPPPRSQWQQGPTFPSRRPGPFQQPQQGQRPPLTSRIGM